MHQGHDSEPLGTSVPLSTGSETTLKDLQTANFRNGVGSSQDESSSTNSGSVSFGHFRQPERGDSPDGFEDGGLPGRGVVLDIVGCNRMKGFVLFAVEGAKRLRGARLRLVQIDIEIYKDDDIFFGELRVQYRKLRGFIRQALSIWTFMTCEFVEVRLIIAAVDSPSG